MLINPLIHANVGRIDLRATDSAKTKMPVAVPQKREPNLNE
jgi:hypothetical protein